MCGAYEHNANKSEVKICVRELFCAMKRDLQLSLALSQLVSSTLTQLLEHEFVYVFVFCNDTSLHGTLGWCWCVVFAPQRIGIGEIVGSVMNRLNMTYLSGGTTRKKL